MLALLSIFVFVCFCVVLFSVSDNTKAVMAVLGLIASAALVTVGAIKTSRSLRGTAGSPFLNFTV